MSILGLLANRIPLFGRLIGELCVYIRDHLVYQSIHAVVPNLFELWTPTLLFGLFLNKVVIYNNSLATPSRCSINDFYIHYYF